MWHTTGKKLTGYYGTWKSREIELNGPVAIDGMHQLIQDGGVQPGPGWITTTHPKRFARTPVRHHLDVDQSEVTNIHAIEAQTYIGTSAVKFLIIAQDHAGYLAVESSPDAEPTFLDRIAEEFKLISDGPIVYGWIHPDDIPRIAIQRTNLA